jgi:hypothetical protein
VEVSRRWHAARQQRAAELIRLEGEETFAGLQRFLTTVHRLTSERRLGRVRCREPVAQSAWQVSWCHVVHSPQP